MDDELENQIPAQDCELEYWLQQAGNYAEVQIPADDLRAIIARAYAAVNALPELIALREENERLREALGPFVNFWSDYRRTDKGYSDSFRFYTYNETAITFGDFRRARAALNQEPAKDNSHD